MRTRVIVAFIALFVVGCSGSQFVKRSSSTLSIALTATNAARNAFVDWDKSHQSALVDAATDSTSAAAKLAAYRNKRRRVVRAFTVAYSSIAVAAALVPLVEQGARKEYELVAMIAAAVNAAAAVKAAIDALEGQ